MRIVNVKRGSWSNGRRMMANLLDDNGQLVISATLHYILDAIKEHGYCVENEADYRLDMANRKAAHISDELLPFANGDVVRVKKGTVVSSTHPAYDSKVLKRAQNVTINHYLNGINPHNDCPNGREPSIVWAGTGGYWHEASIFDCELVKRG